MILRRAMAGDMTEHPMIETKYCKSKGKISIKYRHWSSLGQGDHLTQSIHFRRPKVNWSREVGASSRRDWSELGTTRYNLRGFDKPLSSWSPRS